MATTRWTGTTSGAWATAGNWSNGVPTTGDTVLFPRTGVTNAPSTGLSLDTTNFAKLIVERGATYNIGSSGSPLICVTPYLLHEGIGTFYFNFEDSTAYAGAERGHLVCRSSNLQNAMVIAGTDAFAQLDLVSGRVTTGNTGAGTSRVFIQPETGGINQASIVILTGVTVTSLVNDGGTVTIDPGGVVTTLAQNSGRTINTAQLNSGIVYMYGGIWDQRYTAPTGLTIYAMGGLFETNNVIGAIVGSLYIGVRATINRGPAYQFATGEFEIGQEFSI